MIVMDKISERIEEVQEGLGHYYIVWDKKWEKGFHFKKIEQARMFAVSLIILETMKV